ncbi:GAF domain nucleotide-binding protein [Gloeopeniophorella convolvens]|nr:GAF domain nucleotide-binding protein [Gloeopeniophorella convolvens]
MPHADSSLLPDYLTALLDGQRDWVTNLANTSSLVYHSLLAFPTFGNGPSAVNWCEPAYPVTRSGFYVDASLFPTPKVHPRGAGADADSSAHAPGTSRLLLAPFCGKPACQYIETAPGRARGVCADAFVTRRTLLVRDVDAYPGHIACDGDTKSEIVCPLLLRSHEGEVALGVLDLDCLALGGFDDDDRAGLERIARLVVDACDW